MKREGERLETAKVIESKSCSQMAIVRRRDAKGVRHPAGESRRKASAVDPSNRKAGRELKG